jgi:hypothetical protein
MGAALPLLQQFSNSGAQTYKTAYSLLQWFSNSGAQTYEAPHTPFKGSQVRIGFGCIHKHCHLLWVHSVSSNSSMHMFKI